MILLVKVHHIKIKSHVSCRNNKHYQVQEISVIRLLVGASGMIPKPLEVFIRTFNLPKYRVIQKSPERASHFDGKPLYLKHHFLVQSHLLKYQRDFKT